MNIGVVFWLVVGFFCNLREPGQPSKYNWCSFPAERQRWEFRTWIGKHAHCIFCTGLGFKFYLCQNKQSWLFHLHPGQWVCGGGVSDGALTAWSWCSHVSSAPVQCYHIILCIITLKFKTNWRNFTTLSRKHVSDEAIWKLEFKFTFPE